MFRFMFNNINEWDYNIIVYIINVFILPFAVYLFWKNKKVGWLLMALFLTYSAVIAVNYFFEALLWVPSDIPLFDNFFQFGSPETYFFSIACYCGTLFLICKNNIRDIYKIKESTMFTTIGITTTIIGLITFVF